MEVDNRFIDHVKDIELESMRLEMRAFHFKQINNIIAVFELKIKEYVRLGGPELPDADKKSDLLQILPGSLRDNFL